MTRREERELALALLFEWSYDRERTLNDIYDTAKAVRGAEEGSYTRRVVLGVEKERAALDAVINDNAKGWKLNRISRVSMAVLYLAAYEMLYCEDIPVRVSLNEAIELAKQYDNDKAYAFVNGVLNAVAQKAEAGRTAK